MDEKLYYILEDILGLLDPGCTLDEAARREEVKMMREDLETLKAQEKG